jgi:hypothetical protein
MCHCALVGVFKVDVLIHCDVIAPSSASTTGSLTPSVIGDRPSHPIYNAEHF